jgi:hypothetical protein
MTAERVGDDLAEALAASGWRVLEARVGRARMWALARAAFTRVGTGDVRDFLHELRNPLPLLFERATGLSYDVFLRAWTDSLRSLRAAPAEPPSHRGLPRGKFLVRADEREGVGVAVQLDAPLDSAITCTLRHRRLPPYDAPISTDDLEEVGFIWPKGELQLARFIDKTYGRGERAFVALDCDLAALGCSVRLAAGRVTVP